MKKIILNIIIIIILFFNVSFAQQGNEYTKGFKFSAGISLAVPSSNLTLWSVGAGADILAQYGIMDNLAITGDAGFTNLFGRKDIKSYAIIPVRLGARYYATRRLYFATKAGVGFLKVKDIEGATAFAYSIGAGYMLNRKIDLGLAYDGYSKNGTIGLMAVRLGYFFNND